MPKGMDSDSPSSAGTKLTNAFAKGLHDLVSKEWEDHVVWMHLLVLLRLTAYQSILIRICIRMDSNYMKF